MTEAGTSKTSRSETPAPLPRFSTIGTSTWGADRLFFSPSNQAVGFLSPDFGFDISRNGKVLVPKKKRNGKAKLRWCMVRAVMKWGISVRRVVAARIWQDIFEMRNEAMDPAEMSFDLFDDEIVPEINSGPYCGGNSWAPGESLGPLMQIGHQTANDSFQIGTSTWGADRLFFSPSNQAVGFLSSDFRFDRSRLVAKLRWRMVRAVMKWLTVRRVVAAEKRQGSSCHEVVNSGPYCGGNSWAPGESLGPLMQIGHQTANDSFQIGTSTRGADRLFFSPSNQAVGFLSSDFLFDGSRLVAKLRWRRVRAVMKWLIMVRRVVAAKKWQDLFA